MKNALGGLLSQIPAEAMEMTILNNRTMNVPRRAFRALSKRLEIAIERDIAVLIHTTSKIIMGPGLMETISSRKAAATMRNTIIEAAAQMRKSM